MRSGLLLRLWFVATLGSVVAVGACGARSGLPVGELGEGGNGGHGGEAPLDAGRDVADAHDAEDAEPDVVDARPDVPVISCEEAGITYIYLITTENDLYHFYPPDLSFTLNGTIACPAAPGSTPFSMAVNRAGKAFVLFNQGELFVVTPSNVSCAPTAFMSGQQGFPQQFGMGFSANTSDPDETLFVVGSNQQSDLAVIDTSTFELEVIGSFSTGIGNAELTGTGDGRLFAFGINNGNQSRHLAEIDKSSGEVLSDVLLPLPPQITAWAFAFWGGDFYFFVSTGGGATDVYRYRPEDGSFVNVAKLNRTVVGAGVSTCAPE
jgi:hypothetical protein